MFLKETVLVNLNQTITNSLKQLSEAGSCPTNPTPLYP